MSNPTPPRTFVKTNGTYQVEGRPRETPKVLAHYHPSNISGKSIIVMLVSQPPNAAAPPHTHAGAAVVGLTIQGEVLNQMNSDEPFVVKSEECWYEAPGCHHVRGENASESRSASFFAVYVVDDEVVEKGGYEGLFVVDDEVLRDAREV